MAGALFDVSVAAITAAVELAAEARHALHLDCLEEPWRLDAPRAATHRGEHVLHEAHVHTP